MNLLRDNVTKTSNALLSKLEDILNIHGEISKAQAESLLKQINKIEKAANKPNYKLYELKSVASKATNKNKESLSYIREAVKLEADISKYSRSGAEIVAEYLDTLAVSDRKIDLKVKNLNRTNLDLALKTLPESEQLQFTKAYKSFQNTGSSAEALGYFILYGGITSVWLSVEDALFINKEKVLSTLFMHLILGLSLIYFGKSVKIFFRPHLLGATSSILAISIIYSKAIVPLIVAILAISSLLRHKDFDTKSSVFKKISVNSPSPISSVAMRVNIALSILLSAIVVFYIFSDK